MFLSLCMQLLHACMHEFLSSPSVPLELELCLLAFPFSCHCKARRHRNDIRGHASLRAHVVLVQPGRKHARKVDNQRQHAIGSRTDQHDPIVRHTVDVYGEVQIVFDCLSKFLTVSGAPLKLLRLDGRGPSAAIGHSSPSDWQTRVPYNTKGNGIDLLKSEPQGQLKRHDPNPLTNCDATWCRLLHLKCSEINKKYSSTGGKPCVFSLYRLICCQTCL